MPDPNPTPEAVEAVAAPEVAKPIPSLVVEDTAATAASDPKPEDKPAGAPKAEEAKTEGDEPEVVEDYEYEIPDGADEEALIAVLNEASAMFKELGLTNEKAQKLVDFEFARQAKQNADYEAQRAKWYEEVSKDTELGGDNLEASMKLAGKAIRGLLGTHAQEYMDFLKNTGFDNHPKQFRLLVAIGKKISEDTVKGSSVEHEGATAAQSISKAIYPNLPS